MPKQKVSSFASDLLTLGGTAAPQAPGRSFAQDLEELDFPAMPGIEPIPPALRNTGQGPTVEAASRLGTEPSPVQGIAPRLMDILPSMGRKVVGTLDTLSKLGVQQQPQPERPPAALDLPLGKIADVKGRVFRTYGTDLGGFASNPPTTQQMFGEPVEAVFKAGMEGKPGKAGLAAAEALTDLPFTNAPEMIQGGQIPELVGHALAALTLTAGLGKATHNAVDAQGPAQGPGVVQRGTDWLSKEVDKRAQLRASEEDAFTPPQGGHAGAGNLSFQADLDALLAGAKADVATEGVPSAPAGARGGAAAPSTTHEIARPSLLGSETGMVGEQAGSGPIWFSRLERAAEAGPEVAHPSKWRALAANATSKDEIKWTEIDTWLQAQGDRKVSKAEVQAYLADPKHKLTVEEVLLTDPNDIKTDPYTDYDRPYNPDLNRIVEEYSVVQENIAAAGPNADPAYMDTLRRQGEELARQIHEAEGDQYLKDSLTHGAAQPLPTKYHPDNGHSQNLSLPGGRRYRELLIKFPDTSALVGEREYDGAGGMVQRRHGREPYNSSHWQGQPNVLAHVRFNERLAPDGARVLHLEEIQSDWGQAAREKGFHGEPVKETVAKIQEAWAKAYERQEAAKPAAIEALREIFGDVTPELIKEVLDKGSGSVFNRLRRPAPNFKQAAALRAWEEAFYDAKQNAVSYSNAMQNRGGVPDAPFIRDNSWQNLAMKRMIRYAAENGYDRITWTTGLQQTQRYNEALGAALGGKRIDWRFEPASKTKGMISNQFISVDDTIDLMKPGTSEVLWSGTLDSLPSVVGRQLADKIRGDVEAAKPSVPADHRYGNWRAWEDLEGWRVTDEARGNIVSGSEIFANQFQAEKWIDDHIGKAPQRFEGKAGVTRFDDLDSVGSPGMIQEYDKNLPGFLNKYAKQWGAAVRQSDIDVPVKYEENLKHTYTGPSMPREALHRMGIHADNPRMADLARAIEGQMANHGSSFAQAMEEVAAKVRRQGDVGNANALAKFVDMLGGKITFVKGKPPANLEKVWSIDLTPEMRQSVMGGQPLGFSKLGLVSGMGAAGGAVIGAHYGDDIEEKLRNALLGGLVGGAAPIASRLLPDRSRQAALARQLPPKVRQRLVQQTTLPAGQALKEAAAKMYDKLVNEALVPEHQLKKAGLGKAADLLTSYKSNRLDIMTKQVDRLKAVVKPLLTPADYEDFWAVVRLRRDANLVAQGQVAEGGLSQAEVHNSLIQMLQGVQASKPQVWQAVQAHDALMREVGDQLVADGQLHQATVNRNSPYFPDQVLEHLLKVYKPEELTLQRAQPFAAGKRGWTKEHKGGTRETLRDYGQVMLRYLKEVEEAHLKDEVLGKLKAEYDILPQHTAAQAAAPAGTVGVPKGYTLWAYPKAKGPLSGSMMIPHELATRLNQWASTPHPWIKAFQRANNAWKSMTLRAIWLGFSAQNFLGDIAAHFLFTPIHHWPDALATTVEAANVVWHEMRGTTSPDFAATQALARRGNEEGLGSGAAMAESNPARHDPQLRLLRPAKTGLKGVWQRTGDIVSSGLHMMDISREYLETVPRTARFLQEVETNRRTPAEAAKLTRKIMIDYADLSETETQLIKGILVPFWTFYKNNFTRFTPGMEPAIGALDQTAAVARGLMVLTAMTAYNETFWPEAEANLPEWQRDQFHAFFPWGPDEGDYALFTFGDPLTMAMSQVGLGGMPQRLAGILKGKRDVRDEFEEWTGQLRNSLVSPISPFITEPLANVVFNADIRTGANIRDPKNTKLENTTASLKHAMGSMLAPAQMALRAQRDSGGDGYFSPATLGQVAKQHTLGRIVGTGNTHDDFLNRAYEASGKASAAQQKDAHQTKVQKASAFEATFAGKKPKEVAAAFTVEYNNAKASMPYRDFQTWEAMAVEALKRMTAKDRRLQPFLREVQLHRIRVGEKTAPYRDAEVRKLTPPKEVK